jgi:hypothetical protein
MADAAVAAAAGEVLALKALAPDMIAQCDAFAAADVAVAKAEQAAVKEVREGRVAVEALRTLFDQFREVVLAKLAVTYEASSAFPTPDDFLNAAEDLERTLESADAEWAAPLLAPLSAALEAADKEHGEGSAALKALQKATLQREQVEGAMRPVLVRFRRAVRATFGSRSRQYRELLDRRSRGGEADDSSSAESGGSAAS